ncbi:MAG: Uma2 family endonuclease [Cyanobacteria bacterium J06621_11]
MTYTPVRYRSYEEYLYSDFSAEGKYRLLENGEVVKLPPEDENNVRIAGELEYLLKKVIKPRELVRDSATEIQVHPFGDKCVNREPDLLILQPIHIELMAKIKKSAILFEMPPPAFVAEIVSPGNPSTDNYRRDYEWKRQQYEWWQIPEYWIIDRHRDKVTALVLEENAYAETVYISGEYIQSAAFPTLQLAVTQVLAGREV